jgi:ribosomal protein S27E
MSAAIQILFFSSVCRKLSANIFAASLPVQSTASKTAFSTVLPTGHHQCRFPCPACRHQHCIFSSSTFHHPHCSAFSTVLVRRRPRPPTNLFCAILPAAIITASLLFYLPPTFLLFLQFCLPPPSIFFFVKDTKRNFACFLIHEISEISGDLIDFGLFLTFPK